MRTVTDTPRGTAFSHAIPSHRMGELAGHRIVVGQPRARHPAGSGAEEEAVGLHACTSAPEPAG